MAASWRSSTLRRAADSVRELERRAHTGCVGFRMQMCDVGRGAGNAGDFIELGGAHPLDAEPRERGWQSKAPGQPGILRDLRLGPALGGELYQGAKRHD